MMLRPNMIHMVKTVGASSPRAASPGAVSTPFRLSNMAIERVLLALVILTATGLGFAGIKKNLPFAPEADESGFVGRAVDIVATGDPNPDWLGHPGSTVIYPLAGAYSAYYAITEGGNVIPPDSGLREDFRLDTDD